MFVSLPTYRQRAQSAVLGARVKARLVNGFHGREKYQNGDLAVCPLTDGGMCDECGRPRNTKAAEMSAVSCGRARIEISILTHRQYVCNAVAAVDSFLVGASPQHNQNLVSH